MNPRSKPRADKAEGFSFMRGPRGGSAVISRNQSASPHSFAMSINQEGNLYKADADALPPSLGVGLSHLARPANRAGLFISAPVRGQKSPKVTAGDGIGTTGAESLFTVDSLHGFFSASISRWCNRFHGGETCA